MGGDCEARLPEKMAVMESLCVVGTASRGNAWNAPRPLFSQNVGCVIQNLLYPSLLEKVKEFSDVLVDETGLNAVWFMALTEAF